MNFLDHFDDVEIIADNCSQATIDWLNTFKHKIHITSLGNAGALVYSIELALKQHNEIIYFAEDDYLHREGAEKILFEGCSVADYWTVYDHPDKYEKEYAFGEISKVKKTINSHWKTSASTTMTFATTKSRIAKDIDIWHKYTTDFHPHDHFIFRDLAEQGQTLAVAIPGFACHVDLTYAAFCNDCSPLNLFSGNQDVKLEPWAIEQMINNLEKEVSGQGIVAQTRFDHLIMLDALRKQDPIKQRFYEMAQKKRDN